MQKIEQYKRTRLIYCSHVRSHVTFPSRPPLPRNEQQKFLIDTHTHIRTHTHLNGAVRTCERFYLQPFDTHTHTNAHSHARAFLSIATLAQLFQCICTQHTKQVKISDVQMHLSSSCESKDGLNAANPFIVGSKVVGNGMQGVDCVLTTWQEEKKFLCFPFCTHLPIAGEQDLESNKFTSDTRYNLWNYAFLLVDSCLLCNSWNIWACIHELVTQSLF